MSTDKSAQETLAEVDKAIETIKSNIASGKVAIAQMEENLKKALFLRENIIGHLELIAASADYH